MVMLMKKFSFLEIQDLRPLNACQKHFEKILLVFNQMSVKFKGGTQWYKFFYVATAIATAVYHKNVIKNMD